MTTVLERLPYCVAAWLFLCGLYGIVTSRNLVHMVVCVAVLQTSTYVLLAGIGYRAGAKAPIYLDLDRHAQTVDPVVQALMLTDVVVEATVLALLLALVVRIHARTGKLDPSDLRLLRG